MEKMEPISELTLIENQEDFEAFCADMSNKRLGFDNRLPFTTTYPYFLRAFEIMNVVIVMHASEERVAEMHDMIQLSKLKKQTEKDTRS